VHATWKWFVNKYKRLYRVFLAEQSICAMPRMLFARVFER
jgi:hypothetical protein